ncbi:hypothetical protein EN41_13930 [Agrobacterium tumefaciens]|jgi:hypothetical protein|uniref:Uncharacterized protein n=1 Tax=Agrobacterium fabrum (strain C58 / ATCC 33970) TaxID=176299 RepID=A9CK89_AGRFC|nr:hypothetical protein Atu0468 [Agrobacterium fabrum str. C58]KEY54884.1 hypothetical protein EN41_13930 [Agrobacterium tumefaciens]QRM60101.1 hypothetical protein F3P66_12130 [Agrobacterium fabrum]TRB31542.1 hypothetical protein EXN51_05275 [Agrobacterium fabrum]WJK75106.1 hypothetical protein QOV31_001989 [Agrobacterium fabrum]
MSSDSNFSEISPEEMEIIQSVLKSAGYNAALLGDDQRQFNTAAFLVMSLFLAGEKSADALAAQLKRRLGRASFHRPSYQSALAPYAIRGLPRNMRYVLQFSRKGSARSIEAEEQSWENEGGAVRRPLGHPHHRPQLF